MATVIKAPQKYDLFEHSSVFLQGTIDMGNSVDWQSQIVQHWSDLPDLIVLNPRRDDWDSSWVQNKENPQFREQVTWELVGQENADLIALYLAPESQSPVSLMEFGLFAHYGKIIVCCPDGFYRKGNVDIVCERYKIPQVATLEELAEDIKKRVELKEFQSLQGYWRD
jgi:hypothetical protein